MLSFPFDDFARADSGVLVFPWLMTDLFALASEIGVTVPTDLEAGLALDLD